MNVFLSIFSEFKNLPENCKPSHHKLPLKQRFLNVFRRKSNKVAPLKVEDCKEPSDQDREKQQINDDENPTAEDHPEENAPSCVNNSFKLAPDHESNENQVPSRSK